MSHLYCVALFFLELIVALFIYFFGLFSYLGCITNSLPKLSLTLKCNQRGHIIHRFQLKIFLRVFLVEHSCLTAAIWIGVSFSLLHSSSSGTWLYHHLENYLYFFSFLDPWFLVTHVLLTLFWCRAQSPVCFEKERMVFSFF